MSLNMNQSSMREISLSTVYAHIFKNIKINQMHMLSRTHNHKHRLDVHITSTVHMATHKICSFALESNKRGIFFWFFNYKPWGNITTL